MTEPTSTQPPRLGEWTAEAFNLFGREWQVWVVHGLLACVVPIVVLPLAIMLPAILGLRWSADDPIANMRLIALTVAAAIFLMAVPLIYLAGGMIHTALKQLRGERIAVGDLFRAGSAGPRVLGVFLVWYLVQLAGLCLCFAPYFAAFGVFLYAPVLAVDRRMSVWAALDASRRATMPRFGASLLWGLLVWLVLQAGGAVMIGTVATLPISVLMIAVGYRDTFGLDQVREAREIT